MNKEVISETKILFVLGLFFVWISILLTFIFSRKLTKPLTELEIAMLKGRSSDLDIAVPVKSEVEIGVLAFNEMRLQIKKLLSQIKSEQKKITEYELSLIHALIKPHFLYNKLDLIYVLSSMNNSKQAAEITKALADQSYLYP
jgi:two-component system, sensor histidine kinase YesM